MGRLRTLAILVTLGSGGPATFGAYPDEPAPPPQADAPAPAPEAAAPAPIPAEAPAPLPGPAAPAAEAAVPAVAEAAAPAAPKRPDPPVPPLKYLEAGAQLFNKGHYDLASKYLGAAHAFRDRLSKNERVVLDVYRGKLDEYDREKKAAEATAAAPAAGGGDPAVVAASVVERPAPSAPAERAPDAAAGPAEPAPARRPDAFRGTETWRDTADVKQKARWTLQRAREQTLNGDYDGAAKSIAEAQALNVRWRYFDDTPAKVSEWAAKVRTRAEKGKGTAANPSPSPGPNAKTNPPRDRGSARTMLREARAAAAAGDVDRAESITREVKSWGLRFGLLDDTPEKVAEVVAEARQREVLRSSELMLRSYAGSNATRRGESLAPAGPGSAPEPGPAAPAPGPR